MAGGGDGAHSGGSHALASERGAAQGALGPGQQLLSQVMRDSVRDVCGDGGEGGGDREVEGRSGGRSEEELPPVWVWVCEEWLMITSASVVQA